MLRVEIHFFTGSPIVMLVPADRFEVTDKSVCVGNKSFALTLVEELIVRPD